MDKDLDLNTSGNLPDHTASANAGGYGATSAELRKGYSNASDAADPMWSEDPNSPVNFGDSQKHVPDMVGGVCGRPSGWQR